ncbi:protein windpipe [Cylas formicarius]|uniref:protein windpipe n=1 Tax=Cylas formicarius TaxID=197179 RepID=UPI002958D222|nr:protein windpipe [Cylas formicarius]
MLKTAVLFVTSICVVRGASVFRCPDETICTDQGGIQAKSFKFLQNMYPKQHLLVINLTVSSAFVDKVDPRIKYLKNLKHLDLSHNTIDLSSLPALPNLKSLKINSNGLKDIDFSALPENIEVLDISDNLLVNVPKDVESLKFLKVLHLHNNPLDCNCPNYNIPNFNKMLEEGIIIPETVNCRLPEALAGRDIKTVNCSWYDLMMYDEAGSGAEDDIFAENSKTTVPHLREEDEVDGNTIIDDKQEFPIEHEEVLLNTAGVTTTDKVEEEGSGDIEEGSGFGLVEIPEIPACHVNCSTPAPVDAQDEVGASPLPDPAVQIKMFAEDIYHGIKGDSVPTESASTTTTEGSTSTVSTVPATEVTEAGILKEVEQPLLKESDKLGDVEVFSNNTRTGEMEKATALNQNSYAVYTVVAVGLLLAIVFVVFLIKKRKNSRSNERRLEKDQGFGEEMKPLNSIQQLNEKNGKKASNIPEHIPLINGQNGKSKDKDSTPILTAFTPLAHPEIPSEDDLDTEEPELRHRPNDELLTPPRERVTIRASELPDSIPKTPVLVDRKKNSEGEIVTTIVPP